MKLVLTEEQQMLKEMAEGFAASSMPVAALRRLRDDANPDGFDRAAWAEMAEMGWAGVMTPEAHGGVGLGHVEAGVIAAALGGTLAASPFLSTAVLGAAALSRHGSDAQKAGWLARMAKGEALTALAIDEGRKHAPDRVATTAARHGNGFRLNGAKSFVVDGHVADGLIVSARTAGAEDEPEGVTLFLVPHDAAGVAADQINMVDSRGVARITLENVELDADAVIGEVDHGGAALASVLRTGRAVLAAEMTGTAEAAFGMSVDYIKERTQFGQPIGAFQALQHRAAHLYAELQLAKSIVLKALMALDADDPEAEMLTHAAKAKVGQVAQLSAQEGVQFFGGIGMTDAADIGLYMKRVRAAEAWLGDSNHHADAFARMRGY